MSYLLSDALNKLFPFLSVFLIAKYTSAEMTGVYSIYILYYTFIYSMILLGVSSKVLMSISKKNNNNKIIFTSAYLYCFLNFLIIFLIIKGVDVFFELNNIVYIILLCALSFSICQIKVLEYRVREDIKLFASVNLYFSGILFGAISFCLILNIDLIFIWKIVIIPYGILAVFFVISDFCFEFKQIIKEIKGDIKFCTGQILHILSTWGRVAIDKLCVLFLINITVVGYYSMIMSLSLIVSMFSQSLNNYCSVYLFKMLSLGNYKKCILMSIFFSVTIMLFSLSFMFLSKYFIAYYLPLEYIDYYYLLPIITLAFCFQGFYLSIVNYLFYIDKSYLLNIPSLVSISIMFVSSIVLICFFGVVGAALALFFSWFFQFILVLKLVVRYKNEIFS
ncbi:lipopolysaccharide biosynthesis protein [Photobacterium iliopiscarium]|uniref:lipopolysaccharide biosynthesis protein n=1 Tax=Photobacterium iliopiscarium TaxID=56192 RepID=UPI0011B29DD2|nr:hypothetical protein [Photobacterium iliopiscarium]